MQAVIQAIKRHKRFLITAHVNLEGDSLGSELAAKELIEGLGKEAVIVDSDAVPDHYKFLPKADQVTDTVPKGFTFDAVLVVDCPNLKRTGSVAAIIKAAKVPVINIDHHVSNEKFGDVNWVEPDASSAGEMIFRLYKAMGRKMTKEVALSLYVAILTDTGSFNYDNTTAVTHEITGELLAYGLAPALVSERVYEQRSIKDVRLLSLVLGTLAVNKDGDIASLELTRDMVEKTGADITKAEGFINYARSLDKVKVAVLFKEEMENKGEIKVSFRSKGSADVNAIAAVFGGGGHVKASGCVVKGTLAEMKKKVLAKIEEKLRYSRK